MARETQKLVRLESRRGDGPWTVRSQMNDVNFALIDQKITLEDAQAQAQIKGQRWGESVRDGTQFRVVTY